MDKVLFVSGIGGDTRRYRCVHHQEQLALKGIESLLREDDDHRLVEDVLECDLVILHRVPFSPLVRLVIVLAHAQGKPVVFETDDLVFDPALYRYIGYVDTLSPEERRRFREDLSCLAETFRRSDCVLTTTGFLAEEARKRGKPAYVHRNAPDEEMFRLAEPAWRERQEAGRRENEEHSVVIAYFSGTGSHNRDFRSVAEPLARVLAHHPEVWLHIGGHLELPPALQPFTHRIRRTPYVNWRELPFFIAQADINLAPLEVDNPFCQAKSEIKFVEAALVGVPTVASRTEAYAWAITHGHDGLLATSPEEWQQSLQMLLEHPDLRREMGREARQTVYARYAPELMAEGLVRTLQEISARHGGEPAGDAVETALLAGLGRYVEEMQTHVRHLEERLDGLRQALRQYEDQLTVAGRRNANLKKRLAEHQEAIAERDRLIARQIARQNEIIAERDRYVASLERRIEEIMQGRVMRLMTGMQRWWKKIIGELNR